MWCKVSSQMDFRSSVIFCIRLCISFAYINPEGGIEPKHILLEYEEGSSVNFTCFLNLSHPNLIGVNSSDIRFFNVAGKMIELNDNFSTKIINESSAQLQIQNIPEMFKGQVRCTIPCKRDNCTAAWKEIDMATQINVGYKPQIDSFKCVASNYNDGNDLTCTVTQKINPVSTSYTLIPTTILSEKKNLRYNPMTIDLKYNESEATYSTNFTYGKSLWIMVTGNNTLGNVTKRYDINIYEILIPQQPIISTNRVLTSNGAIIEWSANDNLVGFRKNFTYEISIFSIHTASVECLEGTVLSHNRTRRLHDFITTNDADITYNISLPYAYYKYELEIRSKVENVSDEFYSNIATDHFQTLTKIPDDPPITTTGAFLNLNDTHIAIYWKGIPCDKYNGPNYTISFKLNNLRPLEPIYISKTMGIFSRKFLEEVGQDATVHIYSNNSEGNSIKSSDILIPKLPLPHPTEMRRLLLNNGTYQLSWKVPEDFDVKIRNFTIFWCHVERSECNDSIDFITIDSGNRSFYHTDGKSNVIFAISMNSKYSTSGLKWFNNVKSDESPNNEIWKVYIITIIVILVLLLTICTSYLIRNVIKTKYYDITDIKVELPSGLTNIINDQVPNHHKNFAKYVEKPLIDVTEKITNIHEFVNDNIVRMDDVDAEMQLMQTINSSTMNEYLPVIVQSDTVRPIIPDGSTTVNNRNQSEKHLHSIDCTKLKEKSIDKQPNTVNNLVNNSGTNNEYLPVIVQSDIVQPIIPNVSTVINRYRSLEQLNDSDYTNQKTIDKSNTINSLVNNEYLPVLVQSDIVQPIIPNDKIDNRMNSNMKLEVTAKTLDDNLAESSDKYVKWKEPEILSEEYTNASDCGSLHENTDRLNNVVQSLNANNAAPKITKNPTNELSNTLISSNLMNKSLVTRDELEVAGNLDKDLEEVSNEYLTWTQMSTFGPNST